MRSSQLDEVIELVRRTPDVQFVLDHVGKPQIGADPSRWRLQIAELAARRNIVCKLSGLMTEIVSGPTGWRPSSRSRPRPGRARTGSMPVRQRLAGDDAGRDVLGLAGPRRQSCARRGRASGGAGGDGRAGVRAHRLRPPEGHDHDRGWVSPMGMGLRPVGSAPAGLTQCKRSATHPDWSGGWTIGQPADPAARARATGGRLPAPYLARGAVRSLGLGCHRLGSKRAAGPSISLCT